MNDQPGGTFPSDEEQAHYALVDAYPHSDLLLKQYVDILGTRGLEWGLLGPREGDKLWGRHIANSLALVDVISQGVEVVDVGSGAGLPGLPLAIVRPDLQVTLLEPLLRRAEFLQLAIDELGIGDRVSVVRARAEDVRASYDVVVCRAVAPLERLLKWTSPLFSRKGVLLALKGDAAEEEIRGAGKTLRHLALRAEVIELRAVAGVGGTRAIRVVSSR